MILCNASLKINGQSASIYTLINTYTDRVVSGLPGAKMCHGTKHSSDPSQMYNNTTIGLPTTIPVHLNR